MVHKIDASITSTTVANRPVRPLVTALLACPLIQILIFVLFLILLVYFVQFFSLSSFELGSSKQVHLTLSMARNQVAWVFVLTPQHSGDDQHVGYDEERCEQEGLKRVA